MKFRMTIYIMLAWFMILSSPCVYSQYDLTRRLEQEEAMRIKTSGIKTITEISFDNTAGKVSSEGQKLLYNEFDSLGNCIHWIKFLPNGKTIEERNTIKFDSLGRRTELSSSTMSGTLDNTLTFRYDKDGLETESRRIDPLGLTGARWLHMYDSKGRETESITYQGTDSTTRLRQVFKYDDKAFTVETEYFRGDMKTYRTLRKLNSSGNVLEEKQFRPEGTLTRKEVNSYDPSGRKTQSKVTGRDGMLITLTQYKYDKSGTLIEESTLSGKSNSKSIIKYEYTYY